MDSFSKEDKLNLQNRFGNYTKEKRIRYGITLSELAIRSDMDVSNLQKIENGQKNVTILVIKKISLAFNESVGEFLKDFN